MSTPDPSHLPQNVLAYERSPEHVPVATFPDATEARIAASKLESEDVECRVVEHAILEGISARGATIAVETDQYPKAVEILSATPARKWLLVRAVMEHRDPDAPPAGGLITRLASLLGRVRAHESAGSARDVSAPSMK